MKPIFEWKSGSQHRADPNEAGRIMDELVKDNNLTPRALVDVSRPEDAPLHGEFDWDDETAAEKWRETQASHMIRSIVIRNQEEEQQASEPIRAFFRINQDVPTYQPLQVILKSKDGTDALRQMAERELVAFQKKYNTILEKINATKTIVSLIDRLKGASA